MERRGKIPHDFLHNLTEKFFSLLVQRFVSAFSLALPSALHFHRHFYIYQGNNGLLTVQWGATRNKSWWLCGNFLLLPHPTRSDKFSSPIWSWITCASKLCVSGRGRRLGGMRDMYAFVCKLSPCAFLTNIVTTTHPSQPLSYRIFFLSPLKAFCAGTRILSLSPLDEITQFAFIQFSQFNLRFIPASTHSTLSPTMSSRSSTLSSGSHPSLALTLSLSLCLALAPFSLSLCCYCSM